MPRYICLGRDRLFSNNLLSCLGLRAVFAWLQRATCQCPTKLPSCFAHGVFVPMTQQTMDRIDVKPHGICHTSGCHFNVPRNLACIYCPFCSGHYYVKINGSTLPIFDTYQGLVSTCDFSPLLMQQLRHVEQVKLFFAL